MDIYLPIAGMPVDAFMLLLFGLGSGVLSGLFGVGGGFIVTPLLIFIGIHPAIAAASSANHIIASSFSAFLSHWKRQNVDFRMGAILLIGGMVGAWFGVSLFVYLQDSGQINLVVSSAYIVMLSIFGSMMFFESLTTMIQKYQGKTVTKTFHLSFVHSEHWPLRVYFPKSDITMSILFPLVLGFVVSVLVSIMGIGGGFIMIPSMIYLLGMPANIVLGTSLFHVFIITSNVTLLHATQTHSVDIVLAFFMIVGAAVGAQIGTRMVVRMQPERLRLAFSLLILAMAGRLIFGLLTVPESLYEVTKLGGA